MTPRDVFLAIAAAAAWGFSFVVIRLGLGELPPLLFAALRFTLVAPWALLLPPPDVRARLVVITGLSLGVAQFGLLFVAIDIGMPAGIASVVLQAQVPMTILFARLTLAERPTAAAVAGCAVSTAGLAMIGIDRATSTGIVRFALVIGAGAGWAVCNIAIRAAQPQRPLSLIVWSSLVSPVPLILLALLFEGPTAIGLALGRLTAGAIAAVLYVSLIATIGAFGVWSALLRRHPAHVVAPFALLVPVVGLLGTWAMLGEQPPGLELGGSALVLAGVGIASDLRGRVARAPATPGRSTI